MVEEEVACLERRLSAKQLQPSSTLFDRMIDDIDAMEQTSPTEWEQMKQLKKDIIHRCIMVGRGMADSYHNDVLHEQEKYFVKRGVDESKLEWQLESDPDDWDSPLAYAWTFYMPYSTQASNYVPEWPSHLRRPFTVNRQSKEKHFSPIVFVQEYSLLSYFLVKHTLLFLVFINAEFLQW